MDDRKIDIDSVMVRFLQGVATDEEKSQFLSWLNENNENEVSFFQMKEIYDARKRIPVSDEQEIKPGHHLKPALLTMNSQPLFTQAWMRYAAIIAVFLVSTFFIYLLQQRTSAPPAIAYIKQMVIHNTRGVYAVALPDGSKVWLHGATTITYPEQFSDNIRMVDLKGEAYFAVHADIEHPFVVQTSTAKVYATGTEFNITAYPKDNMTTTTLVKGVVNIQPVHYLGSIVLKPGQQAMTSLRNSRLSDSDKNPNPAKNATEKAMPMVKYIDTELYTDWKEGVYRFKNEPFQNIVLRIEKMYGVNIIIESADMKKSTFSGMFTADYSLKEVLEIINISHPIAYSIMDKTVTIRNKSNKC